MAYRSSCDWWIACAIYVSESDMTRRRYHWLSPVMCRVDVEPILRDHTPGTVIGICHFVVREDGLTILDEYIDAIGVHHVRPKTQFETPSDCMLAARASMLVALHRSYVALEERFSDGQA